MMRAKMKPNASVAVWGHHCGSEYIHKHQDDQDDDGDDGDDDDDDDEDQSSVWTSEVCGKLPAGHCHQLSLLYLSHRCTAAALLRIIFYYVSVTHCIAFALSFHTLLHWFIPHIEYSHTNIKLHKNQRQPHKMKQIAEVIESLCCTLRLRLCQCPRKRGWMSLIRGHVITRHHCNCYFCKNCCCFCYCWCMILLSMCGGSIYSNNDTFLPELLMFAVR